MFISTELGDRKLVLQTLPFMTLLLSLALGAFPAYIPSNPSLVEAAAAVANSDSLVRFEESLQ